MSTLAELQAPSSKPCNMVPWSMLGGGLCLFVTGLGLLLGPTWVSLQTRSYELEAQDMSPTEGGYAMDEYADLMRILFETNALMVDGYNATLQQFALLPKAPESILEIGFGQGDFSILLAQAYPAADVVGIDTHELSVKAANQKLLGTIDRPPNVRFETRTAADLGQHAQSVDVVTTTLVNHHIFPDQSFVDFLSAVKVTAKQAFIFNDLIRSPICYAKAYISFNALRFLNIDHLAWLTKNIIGPPPGYTVNEWEQLLYIWRARPGLDLFARSGVLSVARSFTKEELTMAFLRAGYNLNTIKCMPAAQEEGIFSVRVCRQVCYVDLSGLEALP